MENGRRSYRTISKIVGISTPTVESRVRRMNESGFIKKIAPIFDPDKISEGLSAIVTFQVDPVDLQNITTKLSEVNEIRSIFLITGETNLMLRIVSVDAKDLQNFISYRIREFGNLKMISNQIISNTIKDEQSVIIRNEYIYIL